MGGHDATRDSVGCLRQYLRVPEPGLDAYLCALVELIQQALQMKSSHRSAVEFDKIIAYIVVMGVSRLKVGKDAGWMELEEL